MFADYDVDENVVLLMIEIFVHTMFYSAPIARLYSVSYLWYSAIGFIVTLVVGFVISAIFGKNL